MLDDFKSSFGKVLNERISSPFYGAFIFSWVVWNWKILYLTLFISEEEIEPNKINYILNNFYNIFDLLIYPLISSIILIAVMPFLTNGAFWVSIIFKQWRINKNNEIQKKQLLTIEESIDLREQIKNQEKRFEEILESKNSKIRQLESMLKESLLTDTSSIDKEKVSKTISKNDKLKATFKVLSEMHLHGLRLADLNNSPDTEDLNFFIVNDIIEINTDGVFRLTDFGKNVSKILVNSGS